MPDTGSRKNVRATTTAVSTCSGSVAAIGGGIHTRAIRTGAPGSRVGTATTAATTIGKQLTADLNIDESLNDNLTAGTTSSTSNLDVAAPARRHLATS